MGGIETYMVLGGMTRAHAASKVADMMCDIASTCKYAIVVVYLDKDSKYCLWGIERFDHQVVVTVSDITMFRIDDGMGRIDDYWYAAPQDTSNEELVRDCENMNAKDIFEKYISKKMLTSTKYIHANDVMHVYDQAWHCLMETKTETAEERIGEGYVAMIYSEALEG